MFNFKYSEPIADDIFNAAEALHPLCVMLQTETQTVYRTGDFVTDMFLLMYLVDPGNKIDSIGVDHYSKSTFALAAHMGLLNQRNTACTTKYSTHVVYIDVPRLTADAYTFQNKHHSACIALRADRNHILDIEYDGSTTVVYTNRRDQAWTCQLLLALPLINEDYKLTDPELIRALQAGDVDALSRRIKELAQPLIDAAEQSKINKKIEAKKSFITGMCASTKLSYSTRLKAAETELENTMNFYLTQLRNKQEIERNLFALEHSNSDEEDMISQIIKMKQIVEVHQVQAHWSVHILTPCVHWTEDAVAPVLRKRENHSYHDVLKSIFVDLKATMYFKYQFNVYVDRVEVQTRLNIAGAGLYNPHLWHAGCMGDNKLHANTALLNKNIIGCLYQLISCVGNINFYDSVIMRDFFDNLSDFAAFDTQSLYIDDNYNYSPCITVNDDPGIGMLTLKEYKQYLSDQKKQEEEQKT